MTPHARCLAMIGCVLAAGACVVWMTLNTLTGQPPYCSGGSLAIVLFVLAWLVASDSTAEEE
jgi:hypothetical protein